MSELIYDSDGVMVWAEYVEQSDDKNSGISKQQEAKSRLLKAVIGSEDLSHDETGAPYISGSQVSVSLSHCSGAVVLALDNKGRRIGIDAEANGRSRQLHRVAQRFLSNCEIHIWSSTEKLLLQAWTLKEALYKALNIPGMEFKQIPLPPIESIKNADRSIVVCDSNNEKIGRVNFECNILLFNGFDGEIALVRELF